MHKRSERLRFILQPPSPHHHPLTRRGLQPPSPRHHPLTRRGGGGVWRGWDACVAPRALLSHPVAHPAFSPARGVPSPFYTPPPYRVCLSAHHPPLRKPRDILSD